MIHAIDLFCGAGGTSTGLALATGGDYKLTAINHWNVAGARRFRAAKAAGLKQVPVSIVELDDKQALEVQVIENLQRADVHPTEEAAAFKQLLEQHGYGIEDLATRLGKSERYVRQRLIFNQLAPEVGQAFEDGIISIGHARLLGKLGDEHQLQMLKLIKDMNDNRWSGPMTVHGLKREISSRISRNLKEAPFAIQTNIVVPEAGPCILCPKNSANIGKLFGDDESADKHGECLDRGCWDRKLQAHIALKVDQGLVQLSGDYSKKSQPGIVSRNAWHEAHGKSSTAKKGIVIDGYDAGKIVRFEPHKRESTVGGGGGSTGSSEADRRRSQKVASDFHQRIQEAIVFDQAERTTLTREGLVVVAMRLFSEAGQLGRQWGKGKFDEHEEDWSGRFAALEYFNGRDYAGLCVDLIDLATLPHVQVSGYSDHSKVNDALATAAELMGVDYLTIVKNIQKVHADAAKEKVKAKEKASKAKGAAS